MQLLWRHYIQQDKFSKATEILTQLARDPYEKYLKRTPSLPFRSNELLLVDRVELVARAVASARTALSQTQATPAIGGRAASSATKAGEVVQELEELLAVVQLQLKIYNDLDAVADDAPGKAAAKAELERTLFSLSEVLFPFVTIFAHCSQLYNLYAMRYGLTEAALHIINQSGQTETLVVRQLWKNLVEDS